MWSCYSVQGKLNVELYKHQGEVHNENKDVDQVWGTVGVL